MTDSSKESRPLLVLHLVPKHVDAVVGQGSHKDVASRKRFFLDSGIEYHCLSIEADDPSQLDGVLSTCVPTHVLIEYTYFPRICRSIRARIPDARIAARAINIEPLQHWAVAPRNSPSRLLHCVYACFRLLISDILTSRSVHHVLAISPYEAKRYWKWIAGSARVSWLPYLPPKEFQSTLNAGNRDLIACLPGGARDRRIHDLVDRFCRFAHAARAAGWTQRFAVTGNVDGSKFRHSSAVEFTGRLSDLADFYRGVSAVAVLSPIGHGFKTTVADAIWCGSRALVHPGIFRSMPDQLKSACVKVARLDRASLAAVAHELGDAVDQPVNTDAIRLLFEHEMNCFLTGRSSGVASA